MTKDRIAGEFKDFKKYSSGDILIIEWDRGNGPLINAYILRSYDNQGKPILFHYETYVNSEKEIPSLDLSALKVLSIKKIGLEDMSV